MAVVQTREQRSVRVKLPAAVLLRFSWGVFVGSLAQSGLTLPLCILRIHEVGVEVTSSWECC